jgi:hypothetical protein
MGIKFHIFSSSTKTRTIQHVGEYSRAELQLFKHCKGSKIVEMLDLVCFSVIIDTESISLTIVGTINTCALLIKEKASQLEDKIARVQRTVFRYYS